MKPIIIDDCIGHKFQNLVAGTLFNSNFPWFYQHDITFRRGVNDLPVRNGGFAHMIYDNIEKIRSEFYSLALPIVLEASEKANIEFGHAGIVRAFMQMPSNHDIEDSVNYPHIDIILPHTVFLYYVNDSDGDTVLYEQTSPETTKEEAQSGNLTEYMRIKPKKGRGVFFNGLQFHASSIPTTNPRAVINFNLFTENNVGQE